MTQARQVSDRKWHDDYHIPPLLRATDCVVRYFCVGEALSIPLLHGTWQAAKHPLVRGVLGTIVRDDAGMTTAEYAVGTIAAVAFAAVLYKVVQSGVVQSALTAIIQSALHTL